MHEHDDEPIRVLLVSDLAIVAWGLERLIDSLSPRLGLVGAAAGYDEALPLVGAGTVDVIVVDLDGGLTAHGIGVLREASEAKILALTVSGHVGLRDSAVLAGASGVVSKSEPVSVFANAIEKIHAGELWLDRAATNRIFLELARRKAADPEQKKIVLLTRKERWVIAEIARDASTTGRDIARTLHISEHTLRNHLTSIYSKLELRSRLALYAYALRHKIPEA